MRALDDFLPTWEFAERHAIDIHATRECIYSALREVSLGEIPVTRVLFWLRQGGRRGPDVSRPFLDLALQGAPLLEHVPGEGIVIGLTGRFWELRSTPDPLRPHTAAEFLDFDRPDVCKAVIDFRIVDLGAGRCRLTTETRVHVGDPGARRAFRRYWRVIRPFSGLTRILLLRAVRRRAQAREM